MLSSNNLPRVTPTTENTTVHTPPDGVATNVGMTWQVALETTTPVGVGNPASVNASVFQMACAALPLMLNTVTSTAGAATLNTRAGRIVTEALTTAPGATYTMTLTNSLITAAKDAVMVQVHSLSNTAGNLRIDSVVNGSGSCVIGMTNVGTAALNGTLVIGFRVPE